MAALRKSIDQLAFNIVLVAYDHGLDDELVFSGQRLGFGEIKRSIRLSKSLDYEIPPVKPSDAELAFHAAENVGIWVGMIPTQRQIPAVVGKNRGKCVNTLDPEGVNFNLLPTDQTALRVVAPVNKKSASYYALVDPDDQGLCRGLLVDVSEVFFFSQYRDDNETAVATRKAAWPAIVRRVANSEKVDEEDSDSDSDASDLEERTQLSNAVNTDTPTQPTESKMKFVDVLDSTRQMSDRECKEALRELSVSQHIARCRPSV
jgi:hypothetical protein